MANETILDAYAGDRSRYYSRTPTDLLRARYEMLFIIVKNFPRSDFCDCALYDTIESIDAVHVGLWLIISAVGNLLYVWSMCAAI